MKMIKYTHCHYCGGLLTDEGEFLKCESCSRKTFINSRPTSSAFIIEGNKVLICIRAIDPGKGKQDVIGGFLHDGEDPIEGIKRETMEETGTEIEVLDLLGIYMGSYLYQNELLNLLNICYVARIIKGFPKPHDDVASTMWVPLDKIPDNFAFPWMKETWKDLQKWKRNSNLK